MFNVMEFDKLMDEYVLECFKLLKMESLPSDVNERASVFRFGYYLANRIENDKNYSGYVVDVEYNRDKLIPKKIRKNLFSDEELSCLVVPDLIVHKRGTKDNLAIIEFKKGNNCLNDKKKLIKLKEQYCYKNVYSISINSEIVNKYFDDGEWRNINV